MKVPLSWLREYVNITLLVEELASRLTWAGLEVEEIHLVGLPMPENTGHHQTKITGLSWPADKFVVGAVSEVMPHPDADRLVLCRLDDGEKVHTVLTGAPGLFPYKGRGALEKPIKVAYAREGAVLYDGHKPGYELTRLKRTKIRGVESYSMACSEKELGISDEAEDIIFLPEDAPTGKPLADYLGDAVLEISILPNTARAASILGIAREVAVLTGAELHPPSLEVVAEGASIQGKAAIEIRDPELNPRFILGLIRDIEIKPSPFWVQLRLKLAGMRPINNIVDATNYGMLELGEPLHAFDYDALVRRAGGKAPTIITRTTRHGEKLTTLDDVERPLDDFTVLVSDTKGALSIAGVMGGTESEVSPQTRNVLLEAAAWNFINIRKTAMAQRMMSEASYRFSRGVHPAMAERGLRRGLELMRQWSGGVVAEGIVDNYPLPPKQTTVEISTQYVRRWLGIDLEVEEIATILRRLEFEVVVKGQSLYATAPDHRLDIEEGVVGKANLLEEIARIYGYDRIPETRLADALPPQRRNIPLEREERIRDLLVDLGLQEVITYRMTSPEKEARLLPKGSPAADDAAYLRLANPTTSERVVMRRSLLASVMEAVERNARIRPQIALFEIGPVFPTELVNKLAGKMELEPVRLVVVLSGPRSLPSWQTGNQIEGDSVHMDFYDLKGIFEALLGALQIQEVRYGPAEHPSFHPGKCARIWLGERELGIIGELHPLVRDNFEELPPFPILAADCDLDVLTATIPIRYGVQPVPSYPPVLEDLAFIVDESLPAGQVATWIQKEGGKMVTAVQLFDVYRGDQVGEGKKSLAYSITYQDPEGTLTDEQVAKVRQRIIRRLEQELNAKLRG